ncbi:archaetidylserine decarboxylase [Pseudalkalibacillus berkeleyi]|uniref:Phosphatidylserine decarboxylase proenzyme n=1 Tax=Pseudalkalibacillus berkeleyi TaxID=1069813 RepID=A0ABS9GWG2_9BACL|nr:archaetidylserine decarboxylase [Pseudalkalibacillus berkeleyi]MCF6136141.1 archaetidylserine decarboxylase [Pseudalkalibacillus berkeleyi]
MKLILKYILVLLPHHGITFLVGSFMKLRISKYAIPLYIRAYNIETATVKRPLKEFKSLNDFFTRHLKSHARPIDSHKESFVSPVDGVISQFGRIEDGQIIQAKGVAYDVEQLLADSDKASLFKYGSYMTIYLSPQDYHRIHVPYDGDITGYSYIPGRLYPVNKLGVSSINGLFTKNERLSTFLDTPYGKMAIVKVGALIVGSVQLAYLEHVEQRHKGERHKESFETPKFIRKGEEIGHFEFGSTVILLFDKDQVEFIETVQIGESVKMGELIGYRLKELDQKIN